MFISELFLDFDCCEKAQPLILIGKQPDLPPNWPPGNQGKNAASIGVNIRCENNAFVPSPPTQQHWRFLSHSVQKLKEWLVLPLSLILCMYSAVAGSNTLTSVSHWNVSFSRWIRNVTLRSVSIVHTCMYIVNMINMITFVEIKIVNKKTPCRLGLIFFLKMDTVWRKTLDPNASLASRSSSSQTPYFYMVVREKPGGGKNSPCAQPHSFDQCYATFMSCVFSCPNFSPQPSPKKRYVGLTATSMGLLDFWSKNASYVHADRGGAFIISTLTAYLTPMQP